MPHEVRRYHRRVRGTSRASRANRFVVHVRGKREPRAIVQRSSDDAKAPDVCRW